MSKKPQKEKSIAKQKAQPTAQAEGFLSFLISKSTRIETIGVLILQIGLFIFLKVRFPYPFTESDSGNYILSAATGKINGYRPYGYSSFMRFFSSLSDNIQFLITWQYFVSALSGFLLLFTLHYFFRLNRVFFWILAILFLFNPSILFMNAYVMSDGLFVSLTALWLITGVWLIMGGALWIVPIHLALMYWSIDTRYIGLFYPAMSAIILVKRFLPQRVLAAIGFIAPFIILFWYRSSQETQMKDEFGYETFSAFGGWQKANNGVAVLPYVKINEDEIADVEIKAIHKLVRSFPDSMFTFENVEATNFMWVKSHPGKAFLIQYIQQTGTPYLKAWVYCGTLMDKYGSWLQAKYPVEYFKHFILNNAKNIFTVWDILEGEKFQADQNLKSIFKTDADVYEYQNHFFKPMTSIRKIGDAIVWVALLSAIPLFILLWKRRSYTNNQLIVLGYYSLFIFMFIGVSVYAAPINNFRYLMPIYYFQVAFALLVFYGLFQKKNETKDK